MIINQDVESLERCQICQEETNIDEHHQEEKLAKSMDMWPFSILTAFTKLHHIQKGQKRDKVTIVEKDCKYLLTQ